MENLKKTFKKNDHFKREKTLLDTQPFFLEIKALSEYKRSEKFILTESQIDYI